MEEKMLMTAEEVAEFLGYRRIRTVYELAKTGVLPGRKIPGIHRWFFRRDDIMGLFEGAPNEDEKEV